MRDRILDGYIKDFEEEHGLSALKPSEIFERFANHCVVSRYYPEVFDVEETCFGGGGDLGIDGAAVVVNGHMVNSHQAVEHFRKSLRRLDVTFIFIQSKMTPKFSSSSIGSFISGVRRFLQPSLPADAHPQLAALHGLKEYIYKHSIDMDESPNCFLYYACPGVWNDETTPKETADQGVADINRTNLFSNVEFCAVGADDLKKLYRRLRQKIVREIRFERHTILPAIDGVQEAYLGILPCREYIQLLLDDDGGLNKQLFHDNVRDFQGNNAVNKEIDETIKSPRRSDRFALLNNGVTVVARDIHKVGETFRLKDYQVVNGCQTSHVLFRNRGNLADRTCLPVKLIVTRDADLIGRIIQGTNRQTAVLPEAFHSLSPFHKKLEEFYLSLGRDSSRKLHYERRAKQYEHLPIRREQIFTLPQQLNCFLSMFLNEPHSTHRYYGELLKSYGNRLFLDSHSPFPYYVSALALAALESHMSNKRISRKIRPFRYQMIMLFRLLTSDRELPYLNSRKIDDYCDNMVAVLEDEARSLATYERAAETLRQTRKKLGKVHEPPQRTRVFSEALISATLSREAVSPGARETRTKGVVRSFSDVKGYGFVVTEEGKNVFVHYTQLAEEGFYYLRESEHVELTLVETPKGLQGENVVVVSGE